MRARPVATVSMDYSALFEKFGPILWPADLAKIYDRRIRTIYRWNNNTGKDRKIAPSQKHAGNIGWRLSDYVAWFHELK